MGNKASLEITIPVYNEEKELEKNINRLYFFCKKNMGSYNWQITVADNASVDKTGEIGKKLEKLYKEVRYIKFEKKGRGRAIKKIWFLNRMDICCYMDIDLSTDLKHLPSLIGSLSDGYDIAAGSRLLTKSKVIERSLKREFLSKAYNLLIKVFFQTKFSDAQCGFKAVTRKVVTNLIPYILDNGWFMDSELLIMAKIYEEPVVWRDNPGSTVRILPTAMGDLAGVLRLLATKPWNKLGLQKQ